LVKEVENTADELSERGQNMCITDKNSRNSVLTAGGHRAPAFTLIEIIAVVVILAIAALIAIPAFSGASQMQVKAAADKLAADIEYAKSLAVTTQKVHRVTFNVGAKSYDIRDMSTNTVVNDPVRKSAFTVTYPKDSRLSSVTLQSATFGGGSSVQFDSTGTPQDSGGAALGAAGTVVLAAKGQTYTIKVEPVTGYVSIQ
jgi:prepilin-type N-terminal cleavage/methylation domain-containing protein